MKNLASILTFILIAFGLAWVVSLPLWLHGGLANPLFLPIAVVVMFTPALAAIIVVKVFERDTPVLTQLGITSTGQLVPTLGYSVLGAFLALAVNLGALFVGQAFGLFKMDLVHFSGLEAQILASAQGRALPANLPPLSVLAVIAVFTTIVAAPINALAAIGEEIGWRGFLLTKLLPLGTAPAVIVGGIIWALWHAPLVLLGYNYPISPPWIALGCMSGTCIGLGGLLAWLRLRSASVWPCAICHGAINAGAGLFIVLGAADQKVDVTQATALGWSGWILPVVLTVLLFLIFPPKGQAIATASTS